MPSLTNVLDPEASQVFDPLA